MKVFDYWQFLTNTQIATALFLIVALLLYIAWTLSSTKASRK